MAESTMAERVHIAFFGRRNAGKSSLVNAVTNQQLSLVSDVSGTTTDPVKKSMELLPMGPVVMIDTAGYDDEGDLGALRVKRSEEVLGETDIAVLVADAASGLDERDRAWIKRFQKKSVPYLVAYNKMDLADTPQDISGADQADALFVSAQTGAGIDELRERIASFAQVWQEKKEKKGILRDIVKAGDRVVLVIPIDESAPKDRIILPQQMVLRELLDIGALVHVSRDTEYAALLASLQSPPSLVITDSQAFKQIAAETDAAIPLTSFSILMARYKGQLKAACEGAQKLSGLQDGDTVLISEGCTHHRQCKDIGTVKLPGMIEKYAGRRLTFDFTQGGTFPETLSSYALIVHCGACMLNEAQMRSRAEAAQAAGIPMTNYGIAIAAMTGILDRSVQIFGNALE